MRKKNAKSIILLQTYLTRKTNSDVKLSDESLQIVTDYTEQTNKAWNFQNQLMIKSLEALSKNIQAFNENSDAFAGMNKKLIESWSSIIKESTKNKE
jgi:pyrroloquinoline quinone (PQQ) biosynthesis protein C